MGNTPGKSPYEYKRGLVVEKSVATEVSAVPEEKLEESVAEDLKVKDPVESEKVIAENTVKVLKQEKKDKTVTKE